MDTRSTKLKGKGSEHEDNEHDAAQQPHLNTTIDYIDDHDEPLRIVERARAWDGALPEIVQLGYDIATVYDSLVIDGNEYAEYDRKRLRQACTILLNQDQLLSSIPPPMLYRAQFFMYLANTDDQGDLATMQQHADAAQEVLDKLSECLNSSLAVRRAVGYAWDVRVKHLEKGLVNLFAFL